MPKENSMQGLFFGIDFGTKRIGIAVGQTLTQSARPLITIPNTPNSVFQQIQKLIDEWQPNAFVIGLALQPDGQDSITSIKAKQFGESLRQQFLLPIYYVEERLTSVEANRLIKENRNAQHDKDAIAATLILESWFNSRSMELKNATI